MNRLLSKACAQRGKVSIFNKLLARRVGELKAVDAKFGLSPGHRACLVLACEFKVPAVTTDRAFTGKRGF